jgi:hypothetical protein
MPNRGNRWLAFVAALWVVLGLLSCSPQEQSESPRPTVSTPQSSATAIPSATRHPSPILTEPEGEPQPGGPVEPLPTGFSPRPTLDPSATPGPLPSDRPTLTPSDGATDTVPPGQSGQDILERCLKGSLAFRPPSPLQQGDKVEFVVRVALAGSPIDPGSGLPGTGDPTRRNPRICERMSADLTSSDGVKIERVSNELISIPREGIGEWAWHLTALESGRHEMVLRLLAPDPEGGIITVETFRETITVDVGWVYVATTWIKDMAQSFEAFLAVLTVLGGWVIFVFTRKKRGKHAAKAPAED